MLGLSGDRHGLAVVDVGLIEISELFTANALQMQMNRIEAVTVCVDYADYLEETLPFLLPHVDDLVVITTPEDGRTRKACARHGVRCLPTRCFYREGDAFNKARGINYGLANLKLDGWVLHIDADIVLPQRTRYLLDTMDLDPRKLYGCDRVNCVGRAAWDDFKADPEVQFEWRCLVKPPRRWPLARGSPTWSTADTARSVSSSCGRRGVRASPATLKCARGRPSIPTCSMPSSGTAGIAA